MKTDIWYFKEFNNNESTEVYVAFQGLCNFSLLKNTSVIQVQHGDKANSIYLNTNEDDFAELSEALMSFEFQECSKPDIVFSEKTDSFFGPMKDLLLK